MTPIRAILPVIVLLAVFAAAGCGDDDDDGGGGGGGGEQASADCTASIGVMAPITGDAAELGEEQRNWAQFGLDRFNRENGTKFKLVEGDTQLDPGQASTVAQQFVSDDAITAVVGPAGSQEVEAVGPVFDRASLGFVSQSATQTRQCRFTARERGPQARLPGRLSQRLGFGTGTDSNSSPPPIWPATMFAVRTR